MSDSTSKAPEMLTVAEAAAAALVSPATVMRWIESGELKAFLPPGQTLGDQRRGPKSVRIFADDWRAFLRAHTVAGLKPSASISPAPLRSAPQIVTGTDGIKRRRSGRKQHV